MRSQPMSKAHVIGCCHYLTIEVVEKAVFQYWIGPWPTTAFLRIHPTVYVRDGSNVGSYHPVNGFPMLRESHNFTRRQAYLKSLPGEWQSTWFVNNQCVRELLVFVSQLCICSMEKQMWRPCIYFIRKWGERQECKLSACKLCTSVLNRQGAQRYCRATLPGFHTIVKSFCSYVL